MNTFFKKLLFDEFNFIFYEHDTFFVTINEVIDMLSLTKITFIRLFGSLGGLESFRFFFLISTNFFSPGILSIPKTATGQEKMSGSCFIFY